MPTVEVMNLEQRLKVLERQHRRMKRLGLAALMFMAVLLLMGAKRHRTLEAEQFVLKDTNGKVRAQLRIRRGGPAALTFHDANGKVRADLSGSEFTLYDPQGMMRVALLVTPNGPCLLCETAKARCMSASRSARPRIPRFI